MITAIADQSQPLDGRRSMLRMLAMDDSERAGEAIDAILGKLAATNGEDLFAEKNAQLSRLLAEMMEGPLRPATFVCLVPPNGAGAPYAQILLDDGTAAYTVVPDNELARALRVGDRVLLEKQGAALLRRGPDEPRIGERGVFERSLDGGRVEISIRGEERSVFLAARWVLDQIEDGKVSPGDTLVVNPRLSLALDVLPPADGLAHYRYLACTAVPDVVPDRDIGSPAPVIGEILSHLRLELTNPGLRRRYKLNRCRMDLFSGVPGSGKTMTIQAIWNLMFQLVSDVTGVPVEELPPRVFNLRMSEILNSYLGQSDKNLDRFFTEVEQMAAEPFVAPDGREFQLPVLAVLEEIDGLAAQRGGDQHGIYDRILTTALQRLDPGRPGLKDKLILFIGTTNEIGSVDAAFLRRIGGEIEHFGRLKRRAFSMILEKRLAGLPLETGDPGSSAEQREAAVRRELTTWLFSPNGSDPGVVELTYVGASATQTFHRRDFLTGGLVDRAFASACGRAAKEDAAGEAAGVGTELLVEAIDRQLRNVAEQLHEGNCARYLDLPDGARVASVRRIAPPAATPIELQQ